ncbi:hypothetical protein LL946_09830 [Knoellia locipacati]|uniref:hypothetical protein n=1 Tax=Knoellia locipacati TaxID=882824 RepID=UPI003850808E
MFPGHQLLRIVVVSGLATAVGLTLAPSASLLPTPDPHAGHAVTALVSRPPLVASTALPQDFSRRFGYTPSVTDGLLGDPSGGCSSPVPLPVEFTAACRQHDLGYDLLRYAGRSGRTLPPDARRAIDAQLGVALEASCAERERPVGRAICLAWADVAHGFVRINSVRQGDAVPERESALTLAPGAAAGVAALGAVGLGLGARRARRGGAR